MVRAARMLDRVVGFLDQLEDLGAEAEERLARRARGSGLLANPAQVQARALKRVDAAIQGRRGRDDVVDRDDTVRVGGRRSAWRVLGDGRRQPVELRGGEITQRPAEDASPAGSRREETADAPPPISQHPSETVKPSSAQRAAIVAHQQFVDRRRGGPRG